MAQSGCRCFAPPFLLLAALASQPVRVLGQAAIVGAGAKCNPSLPPASAIHCNEGLYCSTGVPGSFGICKVCTPEKCEPPQFGDAVPTGSTTKGNMTAQQATVGEGAKCNPSLPPAHAILCGEGLYCDIAAGLLGGYGACAKCTPEKCEPPQLSSATGEGARVGEVRPEAAIVGAGAKCNPSLTPASAIRCDEGLYCSTGVPGSFGICKVCTPEKCEPPQFGDTVPTGSTTKGNMTAQQATVGEGAKCNPSLPPAHAILCGEGLYCNAIAGLFGGYGVCVKCTPEKCETPQLSSATGEVATVGEVRPETATVGAGARCNPSLPPAHAIHCNEGLYCSIAMPGGSGTCVKCTPEKCERSQLDDTMPAQRLTVGEGLKCNPSLPPAYAIFCSEGFFCDTISDLRGAYGTCAKCTPGRCETSHFSEGVFPEQAAVGDGEKCNPSLTPAHAIFCSEGLYCSTAVPGQVGMCTPCTPEKCEPPQYEEFATNTSPGEVRPERVSAAGEGERCNPSLPPAHAILCSEGLRCVAGMRGGYGTCKKCSTGSCEDQP